jgi:hypothetical protein
MQPGMSPFITPQPKLASGKLLDLQPPSQVGFTMNPALNESSENLMVDMPAVPHLGQSNAGAALNTSFKESFKNPWTTIPRPMNRFTEIPEHVYER